MPSDDDPAAWLMSLRHSRPGMTAQEFTRETAGELPPAVPDTQPPPADMPPVTILILEALENDSETIYTMRHCGERPAKGLALVGEAHIRDALRSLVADGLIEVECENVVVGDRAGTRRITDAAKTHDEDLQRYWFRISEAGLRTLDAEGQALDAYWDTRR